MILSLILDINCLTNKCKDRNSIRHHYQHYIKYYELLDAGQKKISLLIITKLHMESYFVLSLFLFSPILQVYDFTYLAEALVLTVSNLSLVGTQLQYNAHYRLISFRYFHFVFAVRQRK